jgi:hypothetical protein
VIRRCPHGSRMRIAESPPVAPSHAVRVHPVVAVSLRRISM